MKEHWVEAKDYPMLLVSNLGNVVYADTGEPPRMFVRGNGRLQFNVRNRFGLNDIVQVHRLVAASFFEDSIDGYEINHIDGDPSNNTLQNLEAATVEENREHAYAMGLMAKPIRIHNLDTNETYSSANEAGRKLGYISALVVPKVARETGAVFERRGYRLKVLE